MSESTETRRITLLGEVSIADRLRADGFEVACNETPGRGDIVLVSISFLTGALISTYDVLDLAGGQEVGHLGMLLTDIKTFEDSEEIELMELAVIELLGCMAVISFAENARLPVFRSNDAELGRTIAEFGKRPPQFVTMAKTDRSPDW